MAVEPALNGWTAGRLDDLARNVRSQGERLDLLLAHDAENRVQMRDLQVSIEHVAEVTTSTASALESMRKEDMEELKVSLNDERKARKEDSTARTQRFMHIYVPVITVLLSGSIAVLGTIIVKALGL